MKSPWLRVIIVYTIRWSANKQNHIRDYPVLSPFLWMLIGGLVIMGACEPAQYLNSQNGLADTQTKHHRFVLPMRTVQYQDSILTRNDELLLVGRYQHNALGDLNTHAYVRFAIRHNEHIIPTEATLDSIVLHLKIVYVYGRQKARYDLLVHPLIDKLDGDSLYLSHHRSPYSLSSQVARFLGEVDTLRHDTLKVKAHESWANTFFNRARSSITQSFLENYTGLALIGGLGSQAVLGFSPTGAHLSIHYHVKDTDKDTNKKSSIKYLDLRSTRYNHISIDRAGSALAGLQQDGDYVDPMPHAYLQSGTGTFIQLDMAGVKQKYDEIGAIGIQYAQLSIQGEGSESGTLYEMPIAIGIAQINPTNTTLSIPYFLRKQLSPDAYYVTGRGLDRYVVRTSASSMTYKTQLTATLQNTLADNEEKRWILFNYDPNSLSPLIVSPSNVQLDVYYTLKNKR